MDETLKTIRTIYVAFLTLCFVGSVFLGSIKQPPYAEIATSLKEILDARVYLFPTKEVNQAVQAVEEPAASEGHRIVADLLQAARVSVPSELINKIEIPFDYSPREVMTELFPLLNIRRSVADLANRPARVFHIKSITIGDEEVRRARSVHSFCEITILPDGKGVGQYLLFLEYKRNKDNECTSDDAIQLPISGTDVDVPGTTFRDWLKARHLFKPPLFTEDAKGSVTFLDIEDPVWSEVMTKTLPQAVDYLTSESLKAAKGIKIFDVEVDRSLATWVLPALMFIILLALYLHIENARRTVGYYKDSMETGVPWIGNFRGILAQIFYFVSLVLWPLGIALWFSIQLYSPTLLFYSILLGWCGVVGLGVAAYLASQHLRRLMAK